MKVEASLDIGFCSYKELQCKKSDGGKEIIKFGFSLQKNRKVIVFMANSEEDRRLWRKILMSYVVQQNIREDYSFGEVIGRGGYGEVLLGETLQIQSPAAQAVAIKTMSKDKITQSIKGLLNLINEIKAHWAMIQCENVLKLISLYEDNCNIYLVLEYQKYGSLHDSIRKRYYYAEKQIKSIMEQLLLALDFFHHKKLIHGDIKLENILINQIAEEQYDVRVADFGIAQYLDENESKLYFKCGTPGYIAPEIYSKSGYDCKVDIFSCGVVFYNLVTKRMLFNGDDIHTIMRNNAKCDLSQAKEIINDSDISPNGIDLLMKLLQIDPLKRPSAQQALQHPWFKNDSQIIKELLQVNKLMCDHEFRKKSDVSSFISVGSVCFKNQQGEKAQQNFQFGNSQCQSVMVKKLQYHNNVLCDNNSSESFCSAKVNYFNAINQSRSKSNNVPRGFLNTDSPPVPLKHQSGLPQKSQFHEQRKSAITKHNQNADNSLRIQRVEVPKPKSRDTHHRHHHHPPSDQVQKELSLAVDDVEEKIPLEVNLPQISKKQQDEIILQSLQEISCEIDSNHCLLNKTRHIPKQMRMCERNKPCTSRLLLL